MSGIPHRPGDRIGDDEPLGLRGVGAVPRRWEHITALFDEMTRAYADGGAAAAEPAARRILAATLISDVDASGLDIRARALSNLAAIAEAKGELEESIRLATEAIAACREAEALIGSARGTNHVRHGAVINRAQTRALVGRGADGLEDLAAVAAELDEHTPPIAVFGLHNTLGNALLEAERYAEAEAEFHIARDIALRHEPRLASYAYAGLAALAHRTGDRWLAEEHLRLSRDLQATGAAATARADENLARVLFERGEIDAAEERFAAAEQGYRQGGDPRGVAGSRYGRAAVLLARGQLGSARKLAEQVRIDVTAQGDVAAQISTHLLLGDILVAQWRFPAADAAYLRARALCEAQGTMHEAARIDVRRAIAAQTAAERTLLPAERRRLQHVALNLALPAALATDAMRERFTPGPLRERWISGVSSVALSIALQIIAAMAQTRLAVELLEFVCSAATVGGGAPAAAEIQGGAVLSSPFETPFALAASGVVRGSGHGSAEPDRAPALPARVRALPDQDESFREWIVEAERRYGLPIRSAEVVDAW